MRHNNGELRSSWGLSEIVEFLAHRYSLPPAEIWHKWGYTQIIETWELAINNFQEEGKYTYYSRLLIDNEIAKKSRR